MMKSFPDADSVEMSVRKCCLSVSDCWSLMSLAPMCTMTVVVWGRSAKSVGSLRLMSRTFAPEKDNVSAFGIEMLRTMEDPTTSTVVAGAGGWLGGSGWAVGLAV